MVNSIYSIGVSCVKIFFEDDNMTTAIIFIDYCGYLLYQKRLSVDLRLNDFNRLNS